MIFVLKDLYPLLPIPLQLTPLEGQVRIGAGSPIQADPPNQVNASTLHGLLARLPPAPSSGPPIRLALDPALAHLGDEGYQLRVAADGVQAAGATVRGVFYALQTLRQLLNEPLPSSPKWAKSALLRETGEPETVKTLAGSGHLSGRLEGVLIEDRPRFAWRGFMLDEGRHFHGVETVKALLDQLAFFKLNVFHWHLTEDQGWRFAVPGLERLVEVGSRRPGTARSFLDTLLDRHDGLEHRGFYTPEQIAEIVAYAAGRGITIVPEIDLPGHSTAALAAYPHLGCTGGPYVVGTRPGIYRDILCAGQESTFACLGQVFDTLARLFPGFYVHIGGDEAPKRRWRTCPHCLQRMAELGLRDARGRPDPHALQTWFTNRLAGMLAERGKTAIAWNDALDPALDPSVAVQHWVGKLERTLAAARARRTLVVSDFWHYYLDHSYALTPLSAAYAFDPVYPGLEEGHVHGVEAPLWCEWVPNRARLEYQVWPRLAAVAETGWSTTARKDYADFRRRLEAVLPLLGAAHAPAGDWEPGWLARRLGAFTILQAQTRTMGSPPTSPQFPKDGN